jgi:polygalacturonase
MSTHDENGVARRSATTRREFLRRLGLGLTVAVVPPGFAACVGTGGIARSSTPARAASDGWDRVPDILARITPPSFPARDFDVTRYGAVGDGATDCTGAFRAAIAACTAAGGGRVVVPAGRFLTGAIHLRSRVNLHVTRDATIAFSQDPNRYLPAVFSRWEGVELMNYSPFIYAFDAENIAVTGDGTLDGQADATHWWPWKGSADYGWTAGGPQQKTARDRLFAMAERGVPVAERVFGDGDYLRPQFIQPYRCRNVLIEGVRIVSSPMWEVHPVLCENVTIRRLRVDSHGPNNDGCDPESCRDVLIDECYFDTGDDCIAIKAGRNADGRRLAAPCENIIVRGCRMKDGHGGVTIGSEMSGGVRNVFVEHCEMDSPSLDRALRLKTNAMRGGTIEHVYMRDVTVGQVADAVLSIDFHYEEGANGSFLPVVRDIEMRNVTSRRSNYALFLRGFENAPIADVRVIGCRFENVAKESVTEHLRGLTLRDVAINGRIINS